MTRNPETYTAEPRMLEKTFKNGKTAWAIEFEDHLGRTCRTVWTEYRSAACDWGRSVRETGWATSGSPLPV